MNLLEMTEIELRRRSDIHYSRKIWHLAGVFTLFIIYSQTSESFSKTAFAALLLIAITFDLLRQSRPALNDLLVHIFRSIMRQHELKGYAGTSFLIIGVNIITWLFPRPIVSLTLLFLAFADPIASFVGIKWGRDKIFGHKSIQGFIAAFFVCTTICFVYLYYNAHLIDHLFVVSLLGGLIGALAELIPIGKLDDNLTLPILSCSGLVILFYLFGFFTLSA